MATVIIFAFYYNDKSVQSEIRGTQCDIYNICNLYRGRKIYIFSDRDDLPEHTDSLNVKVLYKRLNINICKKLEDFKVVFMELDINPRECIIYFSGHATEEHLYCFPEEDVDYRSFVNLLYKRLSKRCCLVFIQDCCNSSDLGVRYQYNISTSSFEGTGTHEYHKRNIIVISSASTGIRSYSTAKSGSFFTTYLSEFLITCKESSSLSDLKRYVDNSIVNFDDTLNSDLKINSTIEYLGYIPDMLLNRRGI